MDRRRSLVALVCSFVMGLSMALVGPSRAHAAGEDPACGPLSGVPRLTYARPAPARRVPLRSHAQANVGGALAGPTFNLIFLDVVNATGVGFDDPVAGATRRATAMAVFSYMSSALPHNGTADIEFQPSETDGTGFLGQAQPFADASSLVCQVPFPVTHITTGVDPNAVFPDGIITIDFGYPYNEDLGPVGPGEIDFFTLLLHEATHAIGFVSTLSIGNTGNGPFGMNPDLRISGFDDFVENSLGSPMISCPDGTFLGTGGAGGDLEGPPSLRFSGPSATAAWLGLGNSGLPTLYTPASHAPGSSVTHWDTNDPNVPASAVMIHVIQFATEKRVWSPLELGALEDAGYFGIPPVVPGPGPLALAALACVIGAVARAGLRSARS